MRERDSDVNAAEKYPYPTVVDAAARFGHRGQDDEQPPAVPTFPTQGGPAPELEEDQDQPVRTRMVQACTDLAQNAGARLRRRPVAELTIAEQRRRQQRRANRARQARNVGRRSVTYSGWTLRGLPVVADGLYRVVWQPERAARLRKSHAAAEVQAIGDEKAEKRAADKAMEDMATLNKDRWFRGGAILVIGGTVYFGWPHIIDSTPWWGLGLIGGGILFALARLGRPQDAALELEEAAEEEPLALLPAGLDLTASDRGTAVTLAEGLEQIKVKGQVTFVKRSPAGWGWTSGLSLLDEITEAKLNQLERYLDCIPGGLILAASEGTARSRTMRIIMEDLLATSVTSAPRQVGVLTLRQPAEVGTRFDGGRLALVLAGIHIQLIGRTGSGKSSILLILFDVLTAAVGSVVVGIDLTAGPDMRAWEPAMSRPLATDVLAAERLLTAVEAIMEDRTARLGMREWTAEDGPQITVVIDEYARLAEVARLRARVDSLITRGKKVRVVVVLANQREVLEWMGSRTASTNVDVKIYAAMEAGDAAQLPKDLRDQGVRPAMFVPAQDDQPNDAGKAYVVGLGAPILSRFDHLTREESHGRALQRSGAVETWTEADEAAAVRTARGNVPNLLADLRDAVLAIGGQRTPPRASGAEVEAWMEQQGRPVEGGLTRSLKREYGQLAPPSRDTNLNRGENPKGYHLADVETAITAWQQANGQVPTGQTTD
ncbi:hypothetical protein D5S17_28970 [Pseudonocardiaceae bacterium YIM PH 21723]|nr:hypothetical protein D5S17_28970 [Pseudonocardiaceae bacterium YIM PH 21723]